MDFIDPTLWKLIALCGVVLLAKFWFGYTSGCAQADSPPADDAAECDDAPCAPQGPAMLAGCSGD